MNSNNTTVDALRHYLLANTGLHLLWEMLQIPLYTVWQSGTINEIVFAVLHCTAGDVIIAISTLVLALVLLNKRDWPQQTSMLIKTTVVAAGLIYTMFSEYANLAKGAWTYSDLMPLLPGLDVGLGPVLQWLIVPSISLWFAEKKIRAS